MMGTHPEAGPECKVMNILGLRPVIDLIHFYTTAVLDCDIEKDMETVQDQLAVLTAIRNVKRVWNEIVVDTEEEDWVMELKMKHSLSFALLKFTCLTL